MRRLLTNLRIRKVIKMGVVESGIVIIMNIITHPLGSKPSGRIRSIERMITNREEYIIAVINVIRLRRSVHWLYHRVKHYKLEKG